MKLYAERLSRGEIGNTSFYAGIEGFYQMGFEIIEINNFDNITIAEGSVCFGGITFVHQALNKLSIQVPNHNDYPSSLNQYYGRKIYESTVNRIANNPDRWNVFIKPKDQLKKFTGRYVKGTRDLIGCGDPVNDTPICVSEPVNFVCEWRVFVRYGKILGVRQYKGDWRYHYDPQIILDAVSSYDDAPMGYAIDFGRTQDGRFLIVEVNEGYAIGTYGLYSVDYAKLISARWAEITKQKDWCDF